MRLFSQSGARSNSQSFVVQYSLTGRHDSSEIFPIRKRVTVGKNTDGESRPTGSGLQEFSNKPCPGATHQHLQTLVGAITKDPWATLTAFHTSPYAYQRESFCGPLRFVIGCWVLDVFPTVIHRNPRLYWSVTLAHLFQVRGCQSHGYADSESAAGSGCRGLPRFQRK